jgi:hypothetical protein
MCSPIFVEIVPERSRKSIYALDRSFESVLASFAPPVVGFLAKHVYGYNPVPYGAADKNVGKDKSNAGTLAKALYMSRPTCSGSAWSTTCARSAS